MNQTIAGTQYNWTDLIIPLIAILVVALIITSIQKLLHRKTTFVLTTAILLIVGGVGVTAYNADIFDVQAWVTQHRNQYESKQVQKKAVIKVDRTQIKKMVMRDQNKTDKFEKVGFVAIPSQAILLPIYNDAYSVDGLNLGADYANRYAQDPLGKNIPVMGQGNYGLAAHNFNDGKTGFSGLQEDLNNDAPYLVNGQLGESDWLNGQFVYMANEKGIYRYTITNQVAKEETASDVLAPTEKSTLTIVSCLFPTISKRIITQADLTKSYTWEQAPDKIVGYFNLKVQNTNARADWFNPGTEEGANGDAGGTKTVQK
ncbi:sortase (surface protein transpeptidase) [Weissella koreensis KACC 15510]|uniref:sortase domain-containing protein n=1 Tax=Weissella koreensis TaxID=165096 RepID=UPI00021753AF|nr:sortase [Weissella koreensis]AEJ23440.1 sortase (surface protein transpeptidase) [Weissella koreensis KACC 15510]